MRCCTRPLKSIWRILGQRGISRVVRALVLTRFDYTATHHWPGGHSRLLRHCSMYRIPPQRWSTASARATTSYLHFKLHWLPVDQRILYKLCFLMHTGLGPSYHTKTVMANSHRHELPSSRLSRLNGDSRSPALHAAWNSLPAYIQSPLDVNNYIRDLKTFLFRGSFSCR